MTAAQVIAAYQRQYGSLRTRASQAAAAVWAANRGVSDADAARFVAAVSPIVAGAQAAVASLVAGYVAALGREVTGRAFTAGVSPSAVTTAALRGVPTAEVYRRPIVTARAALADGRPFDEAMRLGGQRAVQLADADVMLAQRAATVDVAAADHRIVGYRRVLTGASCAFCATASTQRYRTDQLMPIHTHCDCSVAPIYGDADPGRVINHELLSNLKARSPEYWKSRGFVDSDGNPITPGTTPVAVRHHGELGPVLADPHHNFDGPADLAA